ncbi:RNA polymerase sigma factor SigJ [Glycomyces harbinensis]|uniref:RNA polymerase sigma-70 factor, ECF subfamily n=1 Tax=Glycomyces harbinensis TaxID=58114 RepID=A0A1G6R219_9ACTN|nr:RNA polymerase sigma factor SigJ [Glycomyces harbinensis]SDC98274.1 RNA polymerase sigma-70 factor, ECF subfamily [Glycomyces harbinensis]
MSDGAAVSDERGRLTNLAYRLLGSLADAEDAVQETYLRWYRLDPEARAAVRVPGAWLTTVAGRVCLDVLGSAKTRRERYVGAWLPEPLPDRSVGSSGAAADPADRVTLDESVDMALLVVLETMTPAERVAFVLHDVFRYPFAEIAAIVGRTPAACRQLATSARRRVREVRGPVEPTAAIVRDFKEAWRAGDVDALIGLLDPDVRAVADGGGIASAHPYPVQGRDLVARGLVAVLAVMEGRRFLERAVNGRPGLVAERDGVTDTVIAFDTANGRITALWVIRNPEKLRAWNRAEPEADIR